MPGRSALRPGTLSCAGDEPRPTRDRGACAVTDDATWTLPVVGLARSVFGFVTSSTPSLWTAFAPSPLTSLGSLRVKVPARTSRR